MSYLFSDKVRDGILANANAGGENVHRGELLGLLLGLQEGNVHSVADLVSQLKDGRAIIAEVDAFVAAISRSRSIAMQPSALATGEHDDSEITKQAPNQSHSISSGEAPTSND